jgi:hypothetical protein
LRRRKPAEAASAVRLFPSTKGVVAGNSKRAGGGLAKGGHVFLVGEDVAGLGQRRFEEGFVANAIGSTVL